MIVPQDEFMLQAMLGSETIPVDVAEEYLRRVRYYHRATSGGPLGAVMLVDMLRFLGHEPVGGNKAPDGQTDWRTVKIGTRVNVRRAGRWSLPGTVCRFAGFVDMGTLAVELSSGHVDEFMRFDVRLAVDETPPELHKESFEHQEGLHDVRLDSNALVESLDREPEIDQEPETGSSELSDDQYSWVDTGGEAGGAEGDSGSKTGDTVSPSETPPDEASPDETDDSPAEDMTMPDVDWKEVPKLTPIYVRIVAGDGEAELHDAILQRRLKNGRLAITLEGEEQERFVLPGDCRLP